MRNISSLLISISVSRDRSFRSRPKIGHDLPKQPVTIDRNHWSRLTEMTGHDATKYAGIADIFEALTANDRPYKKSKKISESLEILGKMCLGGHIDPDLFDIFVRKQVYLRYAKEFLNPEQIDDVNLDKIPGYDALHGQ